MKINEVAVKRDIGINYDEGAADAELRDVYGSEDVDFEIVERVFRNSVDELKDVQSVLRTLKTKSALKSRTNQEAVNQLLQLMINIRKSEMKTLGDIYRERKPR